MKVFASILSSVVGLFICGNLAFADYTPLRKVEGLVIHSSTSVSKFSLDEGRTTCEPMDSSLGGLKCDLDQAQVTLTREDGSVLTVPLTTMTYFQNDLSGEVYNHYIFKGIWKVVKDGLTLESDFRINVIHMGTGAPDAIRGYIAMDDLNISEQIKGTVHP